MTRRSEENRSCLPQPWSCSRRCAKPAKATETPEQASGWRCAPSLGGPHTWGTPRPHRGVGNSSGKGRAGKALALGRHLVTRARWKRSSAGSARRAAERQGKQARAQRRLKAEGQKSQLVAQQHRIKPAGGQRRAEGRRVVQPQVSGSREFRSSTQFDARSSSSQLSSTAEELVT